MSDATPSESSNLSKAERKKARRKAQAAAERAAGRELIELSDLAVDEALRLAPEVADAPTRRLSERGIEVPVQTADAARYAMKRINDALTVGEWRRDVEPWVWIEGEHIRPPLTENGRLHGIELRLERPAQH